MFFSNTYMINPASIYPSKFSFLLATCFRRKIITCIAVPYTMVSSEYIYFNRMFIIYLL